MVLSTHFEEYEKGEELRAILQSLFGTGVFNSDGSDLIPLLRTFLISLCAGELWKCADEMTPSALPSLTFRFAGSTDP